MNPSKPYPILHNGTVTSRAAAVAIQPVATTVRGRILDALKKEGPAGLTREEISLSLDIPIQTVCSRVSELIVLRKAKEWGKKRPTRAGVQAFVVSAIF